MNQKLSISITLFLAILFIVTIISAIGWQRYSNRGVVNSVPPVPPSPATLEAIEAGLMQGVEGDKNYGETIRLTSGGIRKLPDDTYVEFSPSIIDCPRDVYCTTEPYYVLRTKQGMRIVLGRMTGRIRPTYDDLQTISLEESENILDEHFAFLNEHPIDLIALEEHNAHIKDIRAGRHPYEEAKKRHAEIRSP